MQTVAQNIGYYRKKRGLSRQEFAVAIGVTVQAVGCYENNNRDPKYDILLRIANVLGISLDMLFGRTESQMAEIQEYAQILAPIYRILDMQSVGNYVELDSNKPVPLMLFIERRGKAGFSDLYDIPLPVASAFFLRIMRELRENMYNDLQFKFTQIMNLTIDEKNISIIKQSQDNSVKTSTTTKVTQNSPVTAENTAANAI